MLNKVIAKPNKHLDIAWDFPSDLGMTAFGKLWFSQVCFVQSTVKTQQSS